jgi:hypothetical protein
MLQNSQIFEAVKDNRKVAEGGNSVLNIVRHAYELRNQTIDPVVGGRMVYELVKKVEKSFKDLRVAELDLIITEGSFGEFGDVYGLTAPTFYGWIQKYFELYGKKRQEALADYTILALPPSKGQIEVRAMEQWQKNIEIIWEQWKKDYETLFNRPTGFHAGASIYDFLVKQNPDLFDEDFKIQCWEKIKNQKTKYINTHITFVSNGILHGIHKEKIDEKYILALALKTVMVNEYFTMLHQNGYELFQ